MSKITGQAAKTDRFGEPDVIYGWICSFCYRGAFPGFEGCEHKSPILIAMPCGEKGWGGGKS